MKRESLVNILCGDWAGLFSEGGMNIRWNLSFRLGESRMLELVSTGKELTRRRNSPSLETMLMQFLLLVG